MNANKKGKRFELKVAKYLAEKLQANIRRTPNSGGLSMKGDILCIDDQSILSEFNWECKNQEKLNIWSSLQQAEDNAGEHIPLVVFKRNRSKTYVAFELDKLMEILNEKNS